MSEGHKRAQGDATFQSFINNLKHEARIHDRESPAEHVERLLREVDEDLNTSIQSQLEANLLLAKLDLVLETATDPATLVKAEELQVEIRGRHLL